MRKVEQRTKKSNKEIIVNDWNGMRKNILDVMKGRGRFVAMSGGGWPGKTSASFYDYGIHIDEKGDYKNITPGNLDLFPQEDIERIMSWLSNTRASLNKSSWKTGTVKGKFLPEDVFNEWFSRYETNRKLFFDNVEKIFNNDYAMSQFSEIRNSHRNRITRNYCKEVKRSKDDLTSEDRNIIDKRLEATMSLIPHKIIGNGNRVIDLQAIKDSFHFEATWEVVSDFKEESVSPNMLETMFRYMMTKPYYYTNNKLKDIIEKIKMKGEIDRHILKSIKAFINNLKEMNWYGDKFLEYYVGLIDNNIDRLDPSAMDEVKRILNIFDEALEVNKSKMGFSILSKSFGDLE